MLTFNELKPGTGVRCQACSVCGANKWVSNDVATDGGWKLLLTQIRSYLVCGDCYSQHSRHTTTQSTMEDR